MDEQRLVGGFAVAVDGCLDCEEFVGFDRGQQAGAGRRQRVGRQGANPCAAHACRHFQHPIGRPAGHGAAMRDVDDVGLVEVVVMRVEQLGGEGRIEAPPRFIRSAGGSVRLGSAYSASSVFSTSITASARDGGQASCSASFLAV